MMQHGSGSVAEASKVKLRLHFGGSFTKNPENPGEWRYTGGECYLETVGTELCYSALIQRWNVKLGEAVNLKYLAPGEELDPDALVHIMDDDDLKELYSEYYEALQRPGVYQATFRIKVFAFRALVFEMDCEEEPMPGISALAFAAEHAMGIEDGFTVVDDSSDPSADTGWPSISQGHVPVGPHPFLNQEPALLAQQPVPLLPADQAITQHALINISTSLQLAYGPFTPGWAEQNSYQLDDPYQDDEPPMLPRVSERSEGELQQRVHRQESEQQLERASTGLLGDPPFGQARAPTPSMNGRKGSHSRLQHLFQDTDNTTDTTINKLPASELGPHLQKKPLARVREGGVGHLPSRISAFGDSTDGIGLGSHREGTLHLPSHISAFGEDDMPVSINGAQAWEAERQHMQQLYGNKPAAALLSDQTIPLVTQEFAQRGSVEAGALAGLNLHLDAPSKNGGMHHHGADDGTCPTPTMLLDSVKHVLRSEVGSMSKIGEGAFGEVSSAQVFPYGTVAIKWLKRERFAKYSESFQREAEVLAKLNHPNIIRMFGLVTEPAAVPPTPPPSQSSQSSGGNSAPALGPNGQPLGRSGSCSSLQGGQIIAGIMMEYLRGGSLAQHFRALANDNQKLSLRSRVRIALQASLGMSYLHDQSPAVIHFDLKPDNLLLAGEGENLLVKVADFGLSKHKFQSFVTCHDLRGTLPYMAPELVANPQQVCEKCDVYSMGVLCWEMVTLQVPFQELTAQQILMGLMQGNLHLHIPHDCEPEWQVLITACMEHDPRARPSFRMLAAQLETLTATLEAQQAEQAEQAAQQAHEQATHILLHHQQAQQAQQALMQHQQQQLMQHQQVEQAQQAINQQQHQQRMLQAQLHLPHPHPLPLPHGPLSSAERALLQLPLPATQHPHPPLGLPPQPGHSLLHVALFQQQQQLQQEPLSMPMLSPQMLSPHLSALAGGPRDLLGLVGAHSQADAALFSAQGYNVHIPMGDNVGLQGAGQQAYPPMAFEGGLVALEGGIGAFGGRGYDPGRAFDGGGFEGYRGQQQDIGYGVQHSPSQWDGMGLEHLAQALIQQHPMQAAAVMGAGLLGTY